MASHQATGAWQPTPPWSRTARARRCAGLTVRVARPVSTLCEGPLVSTRLTAASQASRLAVSPQTVPNRSSCAGAAPCSNSREADPPPPSHADGPHRPRATRRRPGCAGPARRAHQRVAARVCGQRRCGRPGRRLADRARPRFAGQILCCGGGHPGLCEGDGSVSYRVGGGGQLGQPACGLCPPSGLVHAGPAVAGQPFFF
jgi:hypothetical protein